MFVYDTTTCLELHLGCWLRTARMEKVLPISSAPLLLLPTATTNEFSLEACTWTKEFSTAVRPGLAENSCKIRCPLPWNSRKIPPLKTQTALKQSPKIAKTPTAICLKSTSKSIWKRSRKGLRRTRQRKWRRGTAWSITTSPIRSSTVTETLIWWRHWKVISAVIWSSMRRGANDWDEIGLKHVISWLVVCVIKLRMFN